MVETGSFLQEELEAFNKIYAELLSSPYKSPPGNSSQDSQDLKSSEQCDNNTHNKDINDCDPPDTGMELHFAARFDRIRIRDDDGSIFPLPPERSSRSPSQDKLAKMRKCASQEETSSSTDKFWMDNAASEFNRRSKSFAGGSGSFQSYTQFDTSDKLFLDLLDDLDRISGNTPSARRRKKARDMFSEWLFQKESSMKAKNRKSFTEYSKDIGLSKSWLSDSESNSKHTKTSDESKHRMSDADRNIDEDDEEEFVDAQEEPDPHDLENWRSKSAADCASEDGEGSTDDGDKFVYFPEPGESSTDELTWKEIGHNKVRLGRGLGPEWTTLEDDTDSGYHTGDSTLRGQGQQKQETQQAEETRPGEKTLTREELNKKIDAFNDNQHGLLMKLEDSLGTCYVFMTFSTSPQWLQEESDNTFQGFIRVYMNLMRPISMSLPARPPSIYDVLGNEAEEDFPPEETLTTSFYLPKDTTKVIHISSDTTAQEVIKALLQKFKITDNPRKFALYEKVEDEGEKPTMRRLMDEEKPLSLCLSWTAHGLNNHKFVLQENDAGEIMWEAFSIPELENFLRILDREEEEYIDQVKQRYQMLKIQMDQQLASLDAERRQLEAQNGGKSADSTDAHSDNNTPDPSNFDNDMREPVFV